MRKFLFYIAFLGSLLVITIHILALLGINSVKNNFHTFLLIAFPMIIGLLASYYFKKDDRQKENEDVYGLKILTANKPKGLYPLLLILIVYGIFNFLLFFTKTIGKGTVDIKNGVYVSHHHGKDIKKISKEKYQHFRLNELRFSSSWWVSIYSIITIGLYKPKKKIIENISKKSIK